VSVAALLAAAALGCGIAAAPQPPSLYLPKLVQDLKAERIGDQVLLTWTMPKQTTDGLNLSQPIAVRVCRQTTSRVCDTVGKVRAQPGQQATFTDAMDPVLTQGSLHKMTYEVFAQNARGRAAGASNDAQSLAGTAPLPLTGLTARVVRQGVLLRWQPVADLPDGTVFEVERTLLNAPASTKSTTQRATEKPAQPVRQILIVHPAVEASSANAQPSLGAALDTSAQFKATYRYTVSRMIERPAGTSEIHIKGLPSQPVTIFTKDTFPPAVPQRLVAVVVSAAMTGTTPVVDLSWSVNVESANPRSDNTEPDFAQFRIYRRDLSSGGARILLAPTPGKLPNAAVVTPAFRDAAVEPGHRYAYSVSAVDADGNESAPSPEVVADVPAN